MKKVLFTLAALLTSATLVTPVFATQEEVPADQPTSEPVAINAPVHHKNKQEKMTKADVEKAWNEAVAKMTEAMKHVTDEDQTCLRTIHQAAMNVDGAAKKLEAAAKKLEAAKAKKEKKEEPKKDEKAAEGAKAEEKKEEPKAEEAKPEEKK